GIEQAVAAHTFIKGIVVVIVAVFYPLHLILLIKPETVSNILNQRHIILFADGYLHALLIFFNIPIKLCMHGGCTKIKSRLSRGAGFKVAPLGCVEVKTFVAPPKG